MAAPSSLNLKDDALKALGLRCRHKTLVHIRRFWISVLPSEKDRISGLYLAQVSLRCSTNLCLRAVTGQITAIANTTATNQITEFKRLSTALQDGVVAVEVGPERVKHFVHKAVLEEHSEYFKGALNGSWKEADDKAVCLDDVDLGTFEVFASWLYTGKLPVGLFEWNLEEFDASHQWNATAHLNMVKACVFAHRMIAPKLYKALEREIADNYYDEPRTPYYAEVIYAFDHLPPTSPVLRAMVDSHCLVLQLPDYAKDTGELELQCQLPNAFLVGVMLRLSKLNKEKATELAACKHHRHLRDGMDPRCDYHDHATQEERKACEKARLKKLSAN